MRILRYAIATYDKTDEGEIIIIDEKTRNIHILNPSAAEIFECCDGETCENALMKYLNTIQADLNGRERIRESARKVIEQMKEKGLICEMEE